MNHPRLAPIAFHHAVTRGTRSRRVDPQDAKQSRLLIPGVVAAHGHKSTAFHITPPEAMDKVKDALSKAGITAATAEVGMVPQNYIKLTGAQATQMVRLVEALEEHDDVQHVYANFDIDESEIQAAVGAN